MKNWLLLFLLLAGYSGCDSFGDYIGVTCVIGGIALWLNRDKDYIPPEKQKMLDVHQYYLDNNRYPPDADPKIIAEAKKMYAEHLAKKQPDTKMCPKCKEKIKFLARKCPYCTADI